jgi:hypothetical protein
MQDVRSIISMVFWAKKGMSRMSLEEPKHFMHINQPKLVQEVAALFTR